MANLDLYAATFVCRQSEQVAMTTRLYQVRNTLGTGATATQTAQTLATNIGPSLKNCLSAEAEYRGVLVRRIIPVPGTSAIINTTGQGVGGVAGSALPRQTRGIITLTTGFSGRSKRGRVYVPFPSEASNAANGVPEAAYVTQLGVLGLALASPYFGVGGGGNTHDLHPVLMHLIYAGGVLQNATFNADITGFIERSRWATQRRSSSYGAANVSPI